MKVKHITMTVAVLWVLSTDWAFADQQWYIPEFVLGRSSYVVVAGGYDAVAGKGKLIVFKAALNWHDWVSADLWGQGDLASAEYVPVGIRPNLPKIVQWAIRKLGLGNPPIFQPVVIGGFLGYNLNANKMSAGGYGGLQVKF